MRVEQYAVILLPDTIRQTRVQEVINLLQDVLHGAVVMVDHPGVIAVREATVGHPGVIVVREATVGHREAEVDVDKSL